MRAFVLALVLAAPAASHAATLACSSAADLAALADVRALVAQQCDCESASSPRLYVRCAMAVAQVAILQGRLAPACAKALRQCAQRSTCGRPGAVACCRTTASGRKSCSIKKSAAACRPPTGGTACASQVPSCCEACGATGECAAPTSTTTVPATTTTVTTAPPTTTTTRPGPTCGNGVREPGEACDCGPLGCDFGGVTCPGTSGGGAFLDCVAACTRVDTSRCPGGGTTSTTLRPTTTTTTSTTTTTTSTTTSTLPVVACTDPILRLPPLLNIPLDVVAGSSSCGGPAFVPPATAPFVGAVLDGGGHALSSLGTDCLYAGAGNARVPGLAIPPGNQTVVSVVGLRGLKAILGPSDGSGPANCTRGAGPGKHCVDGAPGRDGHGLCAGDADCGGGPGACLLDAHCFFAPPLAIPSVLPGVDACAVATALEDFCGDIDILGFATTIRGALSNRLYLTSCPTCVAAKCQGGPRDGQRCAASSAGTSVDCPPDPTAFVGAFAAGLALSSESTTLSADASGDFCPGQTVAGAFGLPNARRIQTSGQRPNLLTLQATIAGPFCVGRTGAGLVDARVGLPAPAAVGARARIDLPALLRLFGR